MSATLTTLAYMVAAVLFILALRGLSSPVTSRQGNRLGMAGMAVAAVATLAQHGFSGAGYGLIVLGILIGGAIGAVIARRIEMTALPQLVAAFHSLVGLAAVFVGYYVVWSVTPALHTPLMSVTNAISSVIVVGALLAVGVELVGGAGPYFARFFGFVALGLASVNIFGGFLVTQRMLAMYKKKQ